MARGNYIVIEGADGTGKSTQVALLRERLAKQGIEAIEFHEPGGTPLADQLRTIIKDGTLKRDAATNLLLFTAARRSVWQAIQPQLQAGTWVIAERNYYSTLAYQGYGEGYDQQAIIDLTAEYTDELYMKPDCAMILAVSSHQTRKQRIGQRGELAKPDTFESRPDDFQERLTAGYREIAARLSLPVIAADGLPDVVANTINRHIDHTLQL